eukprot:c21549_g1_i1 orf=424-1200(-)
MEVKLSYEALLPSSSAASSLPCLQAMKKKNGALGLFTSTPLQLLDLKCGKDRVKKFQASCIITDTSVRESPVDSVLTPETRRLILLRHGKSSWADSSVKDHDRPLNEHGRSASASLGSKLRLVGWLPDLILCSDSVRTRETLDVMKECIPEFGDAEVHFLGSFYSVAAMDGQTAQHLQETICKYARDDIRTVMCMGHNRGWEEAASILSGLSIELKTANAALLKTFGSSWQEAFKSGAGGWSLSSIVKPDGSDDVATQ